MATNALNIDPATDAPDWETSASLSTDVLEIDSSGNISWGSWATVAKPGALTIESTTDVLAWNTPF
jgi:hypothetical protein